MQNVLPLQQLVCGRAADLPFAVFSQSDCDCLFMLVALEFAL
jgi:hypothetical protein